MFLLGPTTKRETPLIKSQPLIPFSFDLHVTANDGREDKIDIALASWTLRANRDELRDIQEFIAVPPVNVRDTSSTASMYGFLFNRPHNAHRGFSKLQVRYRALESRGHAATSGRPLFGGYWVPVETGASHHGRRDYVTALQLSLNPLRFVRHQRMPRRIGMRSSWPEPRITESTFKVNNNREFALDGNDNWLPDTDQFRAFANPTRWKEHIQRYLKAVADTMTGELNRVVEAHGGGATVTVSEHFNIGSVEIAFEFSATESTELVRSLVPKLTAYRADNYSLSSHPSNDLNKDGNALSFRMRLHRGVSMRFYAKTNRRVRFEIIYEKPNLRELLGETPQPYGSGGSPSQRPWRQLPRCLAALRERAAEEMNTMLEYLRRQSRVVPSHISALSFLVEMATVLQDHQITHTIASLLVDSGVISKRGTSEELNAALRSLKTEGILAYDPERQGYVVTAPYRHALSMLNLSDTLSLLTTARRRRPPVTTV